MLPPQTKERLLGYPPQSTPRVIPLPIVETSGSNPLYLVKVWILLAVRYKRNFLITFVFFNILAGNVYPSEILLIRKNEPSSMAHECINLSPSCISL